MRNFLLVLLLSLPLLSHAQKQDSVLVRTPIFEVMYSETREQPLWVRYTAVPIKKVADRAGMDFYTEKNYHTSDNLDYVNNVWDKGHMAPAAHFTDSKERLRMTFTYLNSALQHERLNRGEWRLLEAEERKWADVEPLNVFIRVNFYNDAIQLPTGATVPSSFYKRIEFTKSGRVECYYFLNTVPTKKWREHKIECE
jgi:DNA/RNA endonuclease G (NUC1)